MAEGAVYGVVGAPPTRAQAGAFRRKRDRYDKQRDDDGSLGRARVRVECCGGGCRFRAGSGAAASTCWTDAGPATGRTRRHEDPGHRADMLKQNLSLTDDQTSQVKSIFEDSRTKMEALRSNSSLSQDDRRSQMMSLRKAENEKVEALLTPDQKTKYAAMQEQMRGRMRGGAPGGDAAPPPPPPPPQS